MSGKLPIYRFIITVGMDLFETSPIWGEDAALKQTREDDQVFFRPELTGSFRFVRGDFDQIIAAATLEDEIFLTVEEFTGTWDLVGEGIFTLADCEIDHDHRNLLVKIAPADKYREVMAAMDKEFDLVRLEVPRVSVQIATQPVFQIYFPGATYLNNYLNGTQWEQPVIEPLNEGELSAMFTGSPFTLVVIMGDAAVLDPDISGQYLNDPVAPYFGYTRTDGMYTLTYHVGESRWIIVEYASGTRVYEATTTGPGNNPAPGLNWQRDNNAVIYESLTSASTCRAMFVSMYARALTNATTILGNPTDPIPDPDIVGENYNYQRMYGIDLETIAGSSLHDPDAGRWGKFADDAHHFADEYFVRPTGLGNGLLYPVNRSEWTEAAVWFYFDATLLSLQEEGAVTRFMRDGFKVADVLSSILGQVDPTVTHQETAAYSDFFYGTSNPVRGDIKYPIITPKTNITVGEYDHPAAKAPVTLRQILEFLKNAHNVFWWIDQSNRLCLEHITYFENGKSYAAPGIGSDLTALLEPKTGKAWSYKTNRYRFEKTGLWEVRRFKWMDSVSRPFEGYAIESLAKYVNRGEILESNLSPFTSDIDFMQVQPADISKDGFAFMEALPMESPGYYYLPFVEFEIDAEEQYKMQNGYAALVWMIDAYHRDRLPCEAVKINDRNDTATSVARFRVQQVTHPGTADPMLLITTVLGDGRVKEIEQSLSTKMSKITILHDPV